MAVIRLNEILIILHTVCKGSLHLLALIMCCWHVRIHRRLHINVRVVTDHPDLPKNIYIFSNELIRF